MRIEIICKPDNSERCQSTLDNVRSALEELSVEAEVHLYKDRKKMIDNRIYVSPALMIDDDVRVSGRVPDPREIRELIVQRPHYRTRLKDVA